MPCFAGVMPLAHHEHLVGRLVLQSAGRDVTRLVAADGLVMGCSRRCSSAAIGGAGRRAPGSPGAGRWAARRAPWSCGLARPAWLLVVYSLQARQDPVPASPGTLAHTDAPLAQSAERLHGKEKVYGSIP